MPILSSSDYPAVRAALDVSLDANALPDATIALSIFQGAAENEVLAAEAAVTNINSALQTAHQKPAAILLTAARIAPSLPNVVSEALGDYRVQLQAWDAAAKEAQLRGDAQRELSAYLSTGNVLPTIPGMWLARGRRGL